MQNYNPGVQTAQGTKRCACAMKGAPKPVPRWEGSGWAAGKQSSTYLSVGACREHWEGLIYCCQ